MNAYASNLKLWVVLVVELCVNEFVKASTITTPVPAIKHWCKQYCVPILKGAGETTRNFISKMMGAEIVSPRSLRLIGLSATVTVLGTYHAYHQPHDLFVSTLDNKTFFLIKSQNELVIIWVMWTADLKP